MTQEHSLDYNGHSIFYRTYGDAEAPRLLLCVHGLTGNSMDCHAIAQTIADNGYYVASIDMPGRGQSDCFANAAEYCYKVYIDVLKNWMAALKAERYQIDWYGISMGGLLGIRLAGEGNSPIQTLILNDIGPEVPQADLDRINEVLDMEVRYDTFEAFRDALKDGREPHYGPLPQALWTEMADHSVWQDAEGYYIPAYDRNITPVFKTEPIGELDLWPFWENIRARTLVIRGAQSTLFPLEVYEKMQQRFNGAEELDLITFDNCGHVPPVVEPHQIQPVVEWLLKNT